MTTTDRRNNPQAGDRVELEGDTFHIIGVSDGKVCYRYEHENGRYHKLDAILIETWPSWLRAMCNLGAVWVECQP